MWEEATSRRAEFALFFVADDFHCDEDIGGRRQHRQKEAPGCLPGANSGDVSGRVSGVSRIRSSIRVTIWHASEAMIPAIPNGTGVWMAVPASPPLRITIRACLDDCCDECRLPVYRCESEGGQMLRLCMSRLRLPN